MYSMSKIITNDIKYYGGPQEYAKCKLFSNLLFCMLSYPMMNCGMDFHNTLHIGNQNYVITKFTDLEKLWGDLIFRNDSDSSLTFTKESDIT